MNLNIVASSNIKTTINRIRRPLLRTPPKPDNRDEVNDIAAPGSNLSIIAEPEICNPNCSKNSKKLVELGGFIDMPNDEFEAMHPRFTAVNMYRKMCEREQKEFKKNLNIDNIGVALEVSYDDARTKYNK